MPCVIHAGSSKKLICGSRAIKRINATISIVIYYSESSHISSTRLATGSIVIPGFIINMFKLNQISILVPSTAWQLEFQCRYVD